MILIFISIVTLVGSCLFLFRHSFRRTKNHPQERWYYHQQDQLVRNLTLLNFAFVLLFFLVTDAFSSPSGALFREIPSLSTIWSFLIAGSAILGPLFLTAFSLWFGEIRARASQL